MIGAPNTRSQKCLVGVIKWAPATSVSEEIADIFRKYIYDYIAIAIGLAMRCRYDHDEPEFDNRCPAAFAFP